VTRKVGLSLASIAGAVLAAATFDVNAGAPGQLSTRRELVAGPPAAVPPKDSSIAAIDQDAIQEAAAGLPRLHSLLVSWRGELILEKYFNGARASRLANIKSASKSVVSALVGIAIDRKLIPGVTEPIGSYFPDLLGGEANQSKRRITIEHLLTMQSGLATTSNRYYGAWVQSPNWIRHALTRPLENDPGTEMEYSTGNSHLLSAILTRATKRSTWEFAQEMLARPLGFSLAQWPRDPQGIYFGGNDMLLTPRQMMSFGELYLNRGRLKERQVVPEGWIDASFVSRTRSRWSGQSYGYGWWMREIAGVQAFYAWGFGGQFVFVIPDLDLVVVTTSAATVDDDRRSHRRTIDDLIERTIIQPMADRQAPRT
jgi:CubicO group peptidase (beta-lactamase class C family)